MEDYYDYFLSRPPVRGLPFLNPFFCWNTVEQEEQQRHYEEEQDYIDENQEDVINMMNTRRSNMTLGTINEADKEESIAPSETSQNRFSYDLIAINPLKKRDSETW